jgi:hypothetical protein
VTISPAAACTCCGAPIADTDRIDVRFGLPDVAFELPESDRELSNGGGLLRLAGGGTYVRCLLPVRLTGDLEFVLGTWMRIDESDFEHAREVWETPAYAGLVVAGTLANAIRPWGDELLGAPATALVRSRDQIPWVDSSASADGLLNRILQDTWQRDEVLRCFGHPLPVAIRTPLDRQWSVERSAGLSGRVVDGTSEFSGPDRAVYIDRLNDDRDRTPEEFLAALLEGAPEVPAAQRLTEHTPGGVLRHAFWQSETVDGQERHQFYGYAVSPGAAVMLGCFYGDAELLPWARHVWRSVTLER